jgi:hypothetical protein
MKRLLVIALVVLTGCGSGNQTPASAPLPSTSAISMPAFLRVTGRPSGSLVAVVWRNGIATITSRLSGRKVTIAGQGGRYTRHGRLLVYVRDYTNGVRLWNARGRTLWEARITGRRVQIRRGETHVRYEFQRYADGRIVVRHGTVVVGSVRPIEEGSVVMDARGVRLGQASSPPGNGMAVLLCREMAPDLRAVLAAAMLRHR